jgi:hypothetical protein
MITASVGCVPSISEVVVELPANPAVESALVDALGTGAGKFVVPRGNHVRRALESWNWFLKVPGRQVTNCTSTTNCLDLDSSIPSHLRFRKFRDGAKDVTDWGLER